MTPAEKQRRYRERLKERRANPPENEALRHLDALRRLVDDAYGRKIGTMERRGMLDEIEALRGTLFERN